MFDRQLKSRGNQLAVGGRLVMPVGPEDLQSLRLVTRTGADGWREDDLGPVRFVPLVDNGVIGAAASTDEPGD